MAADLETSRWMLTTSAICLPIIIVGFSDVIGSWKTMPMSFPLTLRSSASRELDQISPVEANLAVRR